MNITVHSQKMWIWSSVAQLVESHLADFVRHDNATGSSSKSNGSLQSHPKNTVASCVSQGMAEKNENSLSQYSMIVAVNVMRAIEV